MRATVITIQFESTSTTLATVKGLLEAMNIKYGCKEYEWEDAPQVRTEEPKKAEKKAETSKKSAKTSTKKTTKATTSTKSKAKKSQDSEGFNRAEYEALGKYFGVTRVKGGLVKFARPTIASIMGKGYVLEDGTVKMSKRVENSIRKTLITEAQTKVGEQWAIDMAMGKAQ